MGPDAVRQLLAAAARKAAFAQRALADGFYGIADFVRPFPAAIPRFLYSRTPLEVSLKSATSHRVVEVLLRVAEIVLVSILAQTFECASPAKDYPDGRCLGYVYRM